MIYIFKLTICHQFSLINNLIKQMMTLVLTHSLSDFSPHQNYAKCQSLIFSFMKYRIDSVYVSECDQLNESTYVYFVSNIIGKN